MPLTTKSANRKDLRTGANVDLQHRHFAFIAATIKDLHSIAEIDRTWVAEFFANACEKTNPKFDRRRFLLAANAEERS